MTQNQSPLPVQTLVHAQSPSDNKKEELFDFPTAMKRVAEGKRISRKEWNNTKIYGEMKEEKLMLYKEDGANYAWIISAGDLAGTDWFVAD